MISEATLERIQNSNDLMEAIGRISSLYPFTGGKLMNLLILNNAKVRKEFLLELEQQPGLAKALLSQ